MEDISYLLTYLLNKPNAVRTAANLNFTFNVFQISNCYSVLRLTLYIIILFNANFVLFW